MKMLNPNIRFTLVQKIIASYAAMAFFTIAALSISVTGLYSIHHTARDIAQKDFVLFGDMNKLRESMIAQERYAGRYAILKSQEFKSMFAAREAEFVKLLEKARKQQDSPEFNQLDKDYQNFRKSAHLLFDGNTNGLFLVKVAAEKVSTSLEIIYSQQQSLLNEKLEQADEKQSSTVRWTLLLSFTGCLLAILVGAFFFYGISTALGKFTRATLRISEGDFDYDPQIPPGDELGELAKHFRRMASRLKELEQMSLDASPLTRLPGNIAIERVLTQRLVEGLPFAVCYGDLDNFKAYNDHYGYIKGSEVIKMTGEIIYEAVKRYSTGEPFVGHIGGDDFVMVINADEIQDVCGAVINDFDARIVEHYNALDLARGAIDGIDRYGVPRVFPIMTISVAVILCQNGEYDSAVEIAKNAAEIKDYVKSSPGSNYLINRRKKRCDGPQ